MKKFRKILSTILLIALALTELVAAGFYLSRVPYRLRPITLDPEDIECVRVQEYGGCLSVNTTAEYYLTDEEEIQKLTEHLNAYRIPRERHAEHRYRLMGGSDDVFLFEMKDDSSLRVSFITGSPLLYVWENDEPVKIYHLGKDEVYELDEWFTFYIKQSFWYQE